MTGIWLDLCVCVLPIQEQINVRYIFLVVEILAETEYFNYQNRIQLKT